MRGWRSDVLYGIEGKSYVAPDATMQRVKMVITINTNIIQYKGMQMQFRIDYSFSKSFVMVIRGTNLRRIATHVRNSQLLKL